MIASLYVVLLMAVIFFAIYSVLDAFMIVGAREEGWKTRTFRIFSLLFAIWMLVSSLHHLRSL